MPLPPNARVLDYGCGDGHYRKILPEDVRYIGVDLPGNPVASAHLKPDGTLPFDDDSVDAVMSTQVLEHVAHPARYLEECRRVLKPGGALLLSTHGIMVYHRDPVDYWRWTHEGLRRIVSDAGLEVTHFRGVMGLAAVGLQLFQSATYRRLPRWMRPLYAAIMQSLIGLCDRMHSEHSRAREALVFALLARKPIAIEDGDD